MKQILLVEDDEIMRITVFDRLIREQWQVDTAVNGREALARLEQKHYHLILSDIRMPGMGGMELLDRARRHSPLIDIFMMTAYGSIVDAIACLRNGAADYILKPFEMDDLIIRINRIFEMQTVRARCASLERQQRGHPQNLHTDQPNRADGHDRTHQRRIGHGQGAGSQCPASGQPAGGQTLYSH